MALQQQWKNVEGVDFELKQEKTEGAGKTVTVIAKNAVDGKDYEFGVYSSNGKITEAQIEDSFKIQTNTL